MFNNSTAVYPPKRPRTEIRPNLPRQIIDPGVIPITIQIPRTCTDHLNLTRGYIYQPPSGNKNTSNLSTFL